MVRQKIKCGNIKPGMQEISREIVEVGLFADRYASLFADSISMASFYQEQMDVECHDVSREVDVDKLRLEVTDSNGRMMCRSMC